MDNPQNNQNKNLSAAALRALQEAEARREEVKQFEASEEIGGPKGPEPVRFGDWENSGIASDF